MRACTWTRDRSPRKTPVKLVTVNFVDIIQLSILFVWFLPSNETRQFTASLLTHAREKHEARGVEDGVQFSRYNTAQKANTNNNQHVSVAY